MACPFCRQGDDLPLSSATELPSASCSRRPRQPSASPPAAQSRGGVEAARWGGEAGAPRAMLTRHAAPRERRSRARRAIHRNPPTIHAAHAADVAIRRAKPILRYAFLHPVFSTFHLTRDAVFTIVFEAAAERARRNRSYGEHLFFFERESHYGARHARHARSTAMHARKTRYAMR